MIKSLKEALENLISVSIEIGQPNANYIIGDHRISIREVGPLTCCKHCIYRSYGDCVFVNKLDCPMYGDIALPTDPDEEMPDPCTTDCVNYAHGTCPFTGGEKLQCPRYRLYKL